MTFRKWALGALVLSTAWSAHAGALPAGTNIQKNGSIKIDLGDDGVTDYNLNVSGLIALDSSTGKLVLQQPTSPVSDSTGLWSAGQFTVNGQTKSGLAWHSWLTVNGSMDVNGNTAPTDSGNPWMSSLVITMNGDVDPELNYGFSVRNNGAAVQSYEVVFGETMAPPVSGPFELTADIVGGVTSVPASAGVNLSANTASGFIQELYLRKVSDGSFVNAGVNVGPSFSTAVAGAVSYPYASASASGDTGGDAYDYWEFRTKFKLSPGKDTFVANGSAVMTPVPEPESASLLLSALAVFGLVARRKLV